MYIIGLMERKKTLPQYRKDDPLLDKKLRHEDRRHKQTRDHVIEEGKISKKLAIKLCIITFILASLFTLSLHIRASNDLQAKHETELQDIQMKYDSLLIEHNKTQGIIRAYAEEKLWVIYELSEEQLKLISENLLDYADTEWDYAMGYHYDNEFNKSLEHINRAINLDQYPPRSSLNV